jgi:hypothetical protein
MAIADIKIKQPDINSVAVSTTVAGDRLIGTVLQNKQVFDAFPQMIATHFNSLCDYIESNAAGLDYSTAEIAYICSALGCTETEITM